MSAPIDDLLYGGDDSGDDDDLNTPMRSFSAPLASTGAIPLTAPGSIPIGAPASVIGPPVGLSSTSLRPPTSVVGSMPVNKLPTSSAPLAPPTAISNGIGVAPTTTAPAQSVSAKQQSGSGHQMFQQMFALLKQMLPPEQYAALHSEMRNGNGNDIKSIVDIIKRIAGDAIFASVIQKMDLTRNNSAAAGSLGIIKPETSVTAPAPSVVSAVARPIPQQLNPTPLSAPASLTTPSLPTTQTTTSVQPTATAVQRPNLVPTPAVQNVKTEPSMTTTTDAANGTAPKNDTNEKIQFAKKLLFHASACKQPPSVCQVKKCDDVRRVFRHSVSCGGAKGCGHCKQLRALVEYHAKECMVSAADHCNIPFCDGIRRANLSSIARSTSLPMTSVSSSATMATTSTFPGSNAALSDDDDDNTPLSSVSKAKKNVKAKSPKSSPSPSTNANLAAKKKTTAVVTAKPTTPSAASTTTTASTPPTAAKPIVNANLTLEYGRFLQLILHVEKCKVSKCFVGEECIEAKMLLRQINAPDAPVRAQTYKKVYAHYKVCVAKNNTQNCPMCKIGLMPITAASVATLSATLDTSATPSSTTTMEKPTSATSPTVATLKRSNSIVASPRSPNKKPRVLTKNGKPVTDSTVVTSIDSPSSDLTSVSVNDLRKEADVLTHTTIELSTERRIMMDGARRKVIMERLGCKKEDWKDNDLFNNNVLRSQMQAIVQRNGVSLGVHTNDVMAYALQEYLKQIIEEMVEITKQRGDEYGQTLDLMLKADQRGNAGRELTSTDILRVSCDSSFAQLREEDLMLRSRLLEEAKKEEVAEKERAKKRKKVDRVKLQAQEEKDEAEMDLEELAVKDLKERLLQEEKDNVVRVDGRVNESIGGKYQRRLDTQVTLSDAVYWLNNQKPYLNPKLFVRADAARIVTKSLLE